MHKSRIMIRISFLLEYLLFPFRPVKLFFLSFWIHIFEVFFWLEWKLSAWPYVAMEGGLVLFSCAYFMMLKRRHHTSSFFRFRLLPPQSSMAKFDKLRMIIFSLFFIFDWQVSCSEFVWIFEGCQEKFTSLVKLNQSSNIIDWDYFLPSLFTRVGVPMLYALNFVSMSHSTMVVNGSSIFFRIHIEYIFIYRLFLFIFHLYFFFLLSEAKDSAKKILRD